MKIQIDDEVRDMTDEELENYQANVENIKKADKDLELKKQILEEKLKKIGLTLDDLTFLG